MDRTEKPTLEPEIIQESALSQMIKAETDVAISTAKAFPRDLVKSKKTVLMLAAADQETAEACFFALPRKKRNKKTGKMEDVTIEGESIRLAEIVQASWSNIRTAKRIIKVDRHAKKITAQAVVHDLENNSFASVEEEKNIATSEGHLYNEDMITMTGKAAMSIALRNAIFQVIPKVFFKKILEHVKLVAIGAVPGEMDDKATFKAKPLIERAKTAVSYFVKLGVPEARIFATLEIKAMEEVTEEHLAHLTGIKTGIKDNEVTLADAFPETETDKTKKVGEEIAKDILAKKEGKEGKKDGVAPPGDNPPA